MHKLFGGSLLEGALVYPRSDGHCACVAKQLESLRGGTVKSADARREERREVAHRRNHMGIHIRTHIHTNTYMKDTGSRQLQTYIRTCAQLGTDI